MAAKRKKKSSTTKPKAKALTKRQRSRAAQKGWQTRRIQQLEKENAKLRRRLESKVKVGSRVMTGGQALKLWKTAQVIAERRNRNLDREADPLELQEILSLEEAIKDLDLVPEYTPLIMHELVDAYIDGRLDDRIQELAEELENEGWSVHDLYELWHGYMPD